MGLEPDKTERLKDWLYCFVWADSEPIYYVFIDFKKAFDRVWHAALLATMKKYNISNNLIRVMKKPLRQGH